ncbi:thiamine pyrophosphokinase, partial [Streptomyces sp. SID10244]|nr:thiamine pyrophosphokinase [Streptomyces sp. SID10244]
STFLTRLKVGPKLVDAKAVATLYRSRISGAAIACVVLAALIAVIAAIMLSNMGPDVSDWAVAQYHNAVEWARDVWNR